MTTTTRKGDWFVTFTGRRFYPLDPRVEDIDILDIAHALSLQTRWNGHCKAFYSIASHSLACLKVAETEGRSKEAQRWALMHDAAEAYTGDIIRPIKRSLGIIEGSEGPAEGMRLFPFQRLEDALLRIIAERFGLPWPMPDVVHTIDNRMLVTEAVNLTNYAQEKHWIHEKPWASIKPYADDHVLLYQTSEMADQMFLARAKELGLTSLYLPPLSHSG